jgi:hypothetical protein
MYSIYGLGEWAAAKGRIYNWDVREFPNMRFDETFYGLDFGYSVNPSAVVRVCRRGDEFWVQEIVYQDGLTNPELSEKMGEAGIGRYDEVYADSAEPKSIEEISRFGFNIKPAAKGPDSVRSGIGFLKSKVIHVVAGSEHIVKEAAKYNEVKIEDIDWLIPHQANLRMFQSMAKSLGLSMDKFYVTLHKYGNISSASCAIAFDEAIRDGSVQEGHLVCLPVFGGGLTWGSALVKW